MSSKSFTFAIGSAVALTLSLLMPSLSAQSTSKTKRSHVTVLTGCVVKGDQPNEVSLKTKSGQVYGLESSSIKLESHVGHTVRVTGSVAPEGKTESSASPDTAKKTSGQDAADFRVRTLKMVSKTCQS